MNFRIVASSSLLLLVFGCSGERAESEATLFVASNEAIFESGTPQGQHRNFFRYIYDQSKCNLKIKPTYYLRVGKDFKKLGVIELNNSDQTAGIPATDEVLGESALRQITESWPQSVLEQASRKGPLPIADIELLVKSGGYSKVFLIIQDPNVDKLLRASASAPQSPLKDALILKNYSEYVGSLAKHYCDVVSGGSATADQNNFLLIFLGPESSDQSGPAESVPASPEAEVVAEFVTAPSNGSTLTFPTGTPGSSTSALVSFTNTGSAAGFVSCSTTGSSVFSPGESTLVQINPGGSVSRGAFATSSQVGTFSGTLSCSAGSQSFSFPLLATFPAPVSALPPLLSFTPEPGSLITSTAGGTFVPIRVTPSGGSSTDSAATTTLGICSVTGGGAAFPVTRTDDLRFIGSTTTAQSLFVPTCTPQNSAVDATLTCTQIPGNGNQQTRQWPLRCSANGTSDQSGPAEPVPASPEAEVVAEFVTAPSNGSTLTFPTGTPGSSTSASVSFTNTGSAAGFVSCSTTGSSVFSPGVSTRVQINPGGSVSRGAFATSSQDGTFSGTLSCSAGSQSFSFPLLATFPAPVSAVPPLLSFTPEPGSLITSTAGGTFVPIRVTPSGGSGTDSAATTTLGICSVTGGGAAFPVTRTDDLRFIGSTTTAQSLFVPTCTPQNSAVDATLTCTQIPGNGNQLARQWPLRCSANGTVVTPAFVALTATPSLVTAVNTPIQLSWTSTGTSSCTPSGGTGTNWAQLGTLPAASSRSVAVLPNTQAGFITFVLTCTGPSGTGSDNAAVSFDPPPLPPSAAGTCAQAIAELRRMLRNPRLEDGLPSNKFIEIRSRSDCSNVQRQESSEMCEASIRGSNENLAQFNCSPAS